jgi:hypothetical protein
MGGAAVLGLGLSTFPALDVFGARKRKDIRSWERGDGLEYRVERIDTGAAPLVGKFVALDGSDANPGTEALPWRTVAYAMTHALPGDRIYIRGGAFDEGIYDEDITVTPVSGTAEQPITIGSYPGERAIVRGFQSYTNPNYWTFKEFHVTWDPADSQTAYFDRHLLKINGGTGWIIEDSDIWGAYSFAGLLVAKSTGSGTPTNWTVRRCRIYDTFGGEASEFRSHNIYVHTTTGSSGGLIERCIMANATKGSNVKIGGDNTGGSGSKGVTLRYCTLYNATQPLTLTNIVTDIDVYGNLIGKGVRSNGDFYCVRCDAITSADGTSVHDNAGYEADNFCMDFASTIGCATIIGSGNIFPVTPLFDSLDPLTGFHPQDETAAAYGRYAP